VKGIARPAAEGDARGHRSARAARTPPDRVVTGEVLANLDAEACAGGPPRLLGDLQELAVEAEDVVPADHAVVLLTQDLREVDRPEGTKADAGSGGGRLKSSS
jgi:hypothetical protein